METNEWKESVRKAYSAAAKEVSTSRIARLTKIKASRLYDFGSKGSLNHNDLHTLDLWLLERNYQDEAPADKRDHPSTAELLARDLRVLADTIDSPQYPDDLKAVKLASWIELSHKNLSKLLKTTFGFDIKEFNK